MNDLNVIDSNVINSNMIDSNMIDSNVIDLNMIDSNMIDLNVIDLNVIDFTFCESKNSRTKIISISCQQSLSNKTNTSLLQPKYDIQNDFDLKIESILI